MQSNRSRIVVVTNALKLRFDNDSSSTQFLGRQRRSSGSMVYLANTQGWRTPHPETLTAPYLTPGRCMSTPSNSPRSAVVQYTKKYSLPNDISINKLCAWRDNMPPPVQVDNIFVFIRQVAPVPACWLFRTSATSPVDL